MAEIANRIEAKGPVIYEEAAAGEAGIYPGMLLKMNSSGEVIKHTTEGGVLGDETLIATEDAGQGRNVDTVYTSGDIVFYLVPQKGAEVRMLIEDGQDIAIGERVMSAGNGKLKDVADIESGDTLTHVVGVAMEANDLTGSNTSDKISRIRVV